MKKVKKLSSLMLLFLVGLTGCSGDSTSSEDSSVGSDSSITSSTTEDSSSEIDNSQYEWTINVASPAEHTSLITKQCEAFKQINGYSNISFNYLQYSESDIDTSVTDWSSSSAPDVYAFASDRILALAKLGALAQVPSIISTTLKTEISTRAIEAGSLGDQMYGYPYSGDNGYFLYYNSDYVSATQATTIEGILEACRVSGLKFAYPLGEAFYSMAFLSTFGASYKVTMNEDFNDISDISATYNTTAGLTAAKGLKELITDENVLVGDSSIIASPSAANGIGAIVGGSWKYAEFEKAIGANKLVATKLPTITIDGQTETINSFLAYKLYGVNPLVSSTDSDRLAFDHALAEYLVSAAAQEARFDEFNTAPTNAYVSSFNKVTSEQYIKAIIDQSPFAIPQTIVPDGLWEAPSSLYQGIRDGSISTDTELEESLKALNDVLIKVD